MRATLSEIMLFFRALPMATAAQGVKEDPLPKVIEKVLSRSGRGGVCAPAEAIRAAQRACSRWGRWFGGLDTCLTRSLVAGGLLAGSHEVVLHVGFRPTDRGADGVDGHAWLIVDGEALELTGLNERHEEPYESSLQLRMG